MVRRALGYAGVAAAWLLACGTSGPPRATARAPAVAAGAPSVATERPPPPAAAPSPSAATPPPPKPRRPGSYANVDPDDDFVVGPPDPIDDCEAALGKAGVKFQRATLPVHTPKGSSFACGAPQVVTYLKGPGDITYGAPPLLTCAMALALASFEKIVQEEAASVLRSRVARVNHIGTYVCREMAAYKGWVSEHSYANAIDLASFVLADGRTVDVLRDFDAGADEPKKPAALFLRKVSRRANDEDVFSHVLTPFFDALHKNHFHLDLARYRTDGTRPQS